MRPSLHRVCVELAGAVLRLTATVLTIGQISNANQEGPHRGLDLLTPWSQRW